MKNKIINIFNDKLSTLRHYIKLFFFKSPMSENLSLLYLFYDLKAKIIFKFEKFELYKTKTKETKEFKKYGFTVFTNRIIRKECNSILKKIIQK